MKKILLSLAAFLFVFVSFAFSQEEKITISTYYPSPYGVYNEMRFFPHGTPTMNCTLENEGTTYFDSDEHLLKVCACPGGDYTKCDWTTLQGGGGGGGGGAFKECIDVQNITVSPGCHGCARFNVQCPEGYIVTGGGGVCNKWAHYLYQSLASGNGWQIGCKGTCTGWDCATDQHTFVYARCCKKPENPPTP